MDLTEGEYAEDESQDSEDDELQFLLYSQLHYEQAEDPDTPKKSDPDLTEHLESPVPEKLSRSHISQAVKKKKDSLKTNKLKRGASSKLHNPRKKQKIDQKVRTNSRSELSSRKWSNNVMNVDSDTAFGSSDYETSEPSFIHSPTIAAPTKRKEKVVIETENDTSVIEISSDSSDCVIIDNSESSSDSSSSDSSSSVDSSVSNISTTLLSVHVKGKVDLWDSTPSIKNDRWAINEKDRLAGLALDTKPARGGGTHDKGKRYYTPAKIVTCYKCGCEGHNGHRCNIKLCFNCDQPGHVANHCETKLNNRIQRCKRCLMLGHRTQFCPDNWRQFHVTTSIVPNMVVMKHECRNKRTFCYNCTGNDHFGYECPNDRPYGYRVPTYPFVARYENREYLEHLFYDASVTQFSSKSTQYGHNASWSRKKRYKRAKKRKGKERKSKGKERNHLHQGGL